MIASDDSVTRERQSYTTGINCIEQINKFSKSDFLQKVRLHNRFITPTDECIQQEKNSRFDYPEFLTLGSHLDLAFFDAGWRLIQFLLERETFMFAKTHTTGSSGVGNYCTRNSMESGF